MFVVIKKLIITEKICNYNDNDNDNLISISIEVNKTVCLFFIKKF